MAITDEELDRVSVVGGGSIYTAVQNLMLACRAEGSRLRADHAVVHTRRKGPRNSRNPAAVGNRRRHSDGLSRSPAATVRSGAEPQNNSSTRITGARRSNERPHRNGATSCPGIRQTRARNRTRPSRSTRRVEADGRCRLLPDVRARRHTAVSKRRRQMHHAYSKRSPARTHRVVGSRSLAPPADRCLARLPADAAREIFNDPEHADLRRIRAVGQSRESSHGGFNVNGRWQWGSGTQNAQWILGGCTIHARRRLAANGQRRATHPHAAVCAGSASLPRHVARERPTR